jgi:hypothetical protein
LTLWRDHLATCERLTTKKAGASFAFVSTVNIETGIESTRESEFAQEKWGSATKAYLVNIASKLANCPTKFDGLVMEAKRWANLEECANSGPSLTASRSGLVDERAVLMDDSDD